MSVQMASQGKMPVVLLKDGSSETKGRDAHKNNIAASKIIAEIVRTSLGPRGMDKMLVDSLGDVTITNDGATILKEIDVQHPAAKMLVEISKTTDNEVGDGTTSAVVLAGALLENAEALVNQDVHPTIIVDGYRKASKQAGSFLAEIGENISTDDVETLKKVARTAMQTKLVKSDSDQLADIVVQAIMSVTEKDDDGYKVDVDDIKVEKKAGASIKNSEIVRGVVLDKEIVHGGMPRRASNARIALLNSALEINKTETDAKINISNPQQIKIFLEEENRMLKSMVDKIVASGANVVLCQKGIDDMAQHYLAKAGVMAVRRIKESDLTKLAKATGTQIVTNLDDLPNVTLGVAEVVEEQKIEEDKWVFIRGCNNPKSVSILLRGGSQRVVDEVERSIHDALMVVRDVTLRPSVVAGGGAPETFVATSLRNWSSTLDGREQLAAEKFADSMESIPLALAENAGMDPIDTLTSLRSRQLKGERWVGIDVTKAAVSDMKASEIIEPLSVKLQVVMAATEAACMLLRIDDVITTAKSAGPPPGAEGGMGGMPGMGGMGGMGGMPDMGGMM
ncbi:MAG: thermosome subunit [Cenarchaeum sp. SB0665_bin_23]|nr:thermosome subunit [Cenarchaeum sp. SB0667_bin_13]MXY37804.1 thermosome subunit [Cenarchaeum sp. SB0664_bin_35]MXY61357.1 thermosome subunit [Cenarchaeum sp. SB0665_bin_23]MYB46742.1 thermosome subunit [Cenarchaeum sp. SB0662_bin_33]MYC79661.1 thermosome subunit [Cenarchaeum sp. SB0661_bin_35]MYG32721.1 thermosome subunit [Cenarchaeum sp. SB0677_bin_16]